MSPMMAPAAGGSQRGEDTVRSLFPRGVTAVLATPEMETEPLLGPEEACIPRAVPKRRREFVLGRACARRGMASFGVRGVPLLPGANREPLWPAGLVGSITHCEDFCAAVVSARGDLLGLGIDAEPARPFPAEIIRRVCSPAEREQIESLPAPPAPDWYRLVFSAKESVYKACHPLVRRVLEFAEVEVAIDPETGRFGIEAASEELAAALEGVELRGRFAFTGTHLLTAVTALGSTVRVLA